MYNRQSRRCAACLAAAASSVATAGSRSWATSSSASASLLAKPSSSFSTSAPSRREPPFSRKEEAKFGSPNQGRPSPNRTRRDKGDDFDADKRSDRWSESARSSSSSFRSFTPKSRFLEPRHRSDAKGDHSSGFRNKSRDRDNGDRPPLGSQHGKRNAGRPTLSPEQVRKLGKQRARENEDAQNHWRQISGELLESDVNLDLQEVRRRKEERFTPGDFVELRK